MKRTGIYGVVLTAVVAGAFFLRAYALDRRPMHHDEANQAVRAGILEHVGRYRYDPNEHHGPTLYYFTMPGAWITAGRDFTQTTVATFRMVPLVFGVAFLLLLPLVTDGLGRGATVAAAVLYAISPILVFYNRFYIQESLLVTFTFGTVACGWRFARTRRPGWAIAAGVCVGLMYTTKETCILAWAAMAVALALTAPRPTLAALRDARTRRGVLLAAAAALFVALLFFSSLFTNWAGPLDSLRTYGVYAGRAGGEHTDHVHGWAFYLKRLYWTRSAGMLWTEGASLLFGVLGAALAWWPRINIGGIDRPFVRFLSVYTLALTALYSAIPYKTPWCALSFHSGLILLAGVGVAGAWCAWKPWPARTVLVLAVAAALMQLGRQTGRANFRFDADPRNPCVYAQTGRDYLRLVKRIRDIAALHPKGKSMLVASVTSASDMWPLPWYLRDFDHVGYWTSPDELPAGVSPAIVVASPERDEAIAARLGDGYQVEYYGLRPEVLVTLYIRRDLWDALLAQRAKQTKS